VKRLLFLVLQAPDASLNLTINITTTTITTITRAIDYYGFSDHDKCSEDVVEIDH